MKIEDPHKIKKRVRMGLVVLLFAIIILYANNRTSFLSQGVNLVVDDISNGQIVFEEELTVQGQALRATQLLLNGREIAINQEGHFSELILLSPGLNTIRIRAQDKFGKYKEITYNILYEENKDEPQTLDTLLQNLHNTLQTNTETLLDSSLTPETISEEHVGEIETLETSGEGEDTAPPDQGSLETNTIN